MCRKYLLSLTQNPESFPTERNLIEMNDSSKAKSLHLVPSRENSFDESALLFLKKSCAVIEIPTVVDTRQAVTSGHFGHFTIGIATYKYPAPARQLRLAAPLMIRSIPRERFPRENPSHILS